MGEWFGQTVDADILKIEDAKYFDRFSSTTEGEVVEGEGIWPGQSFQHSIQDESTHTSLTHSLMLLPTI